MMRKAWLLLVLAASGPGCLSSGTHVETESRRVPPVRMAEAPPPPVTGDQVTEGNVADITQALSKEMDYDVNSRPTMTTNANPMKP